MKPTVARDLIHMYQQMGCLRPYKKPLNSARPWTNMVRPQPSYTVDVKNKLDKTTNT